MSIRVTCSKGHVLKAKESQAGRAFKCPVCGEMVTVPKPSEASAAMTDSSGMPEFADAGKGNSALDIGLEGLPEMVGLDAVRATQTGPAWNGSFQSGAMQQAEDVKPSAPDRSGSARPARKASTPMHQESRGSLSWGHFAAGIGSGALVGGLLLGTIVWMSRRASEPSEARGANAPGVPDQIVAAVQAGSNAQPSVPNSTETAKAEAISEQVSAAPKEDLVAISKKLRQIAVAFSNYEATYRNFEIPEASRGLSWRVHLLPYLDQAPLYKQFHLEEAWDSPHNQSLMQHMPEVYRIAGSEDFKTRFQTPVGQDMIFGSKEKASMNKIPDGITNTVMLVVTGQDKAIEWTKPDGLAIDRNAPFEALGRLPDHYISVASAGFMPAILSTKMKAEDFYALLTPRGGEITDLEKYDAMYKPGGTGPRGASVSPNERINARKKQLREIGGACSSYLSTFKQYPPSSVPMGLSPHGEHTVSWRVLILPYLGQDTLFKEFHLDESWDSTHNLKLLDKMPSIYRDLGDPIGTTKTRILRLTGPGAAFLTKGPGVQVSAISNPSETIHLVSVGQDKSVPWTKPEDVVWDANAPLRCLGTMDADVIAGVRFDGTVFTLKQSIPPALLQDWVTIGAKTIGPEHAKHRLD